MIFAAGVVIGIVFWDDHPWTSLGVVIASAIIHVTTM